MLRFRALGSPVVEGAAGPVGGAGAQRKSLALLALLAASGGRGVSRDRIIAYLWPEAEADKAGHRLTQLAYALRRDLGSDDLFLGSADLRLNPAVISSDVQEFIAARRAGDLERAVSVYGGPFLDGFFLTGAPEFERWMENERAGLARDYGEALETLAADAGVRGDHRLAASWWRRLAGHDPLSSRVTVHLMSALASAGRRAEALEQARAYQELIREELEAAPNPAVLALAAQLRQRPADMPLGAAANPPAAVSVAVLPFTNLSAVSRNDFFAEGMAQELTSALARLAGVRVVARTSLNALKDVPVDVREIGRRLSATAVIEGTVRQEGDRVRLTAQLVATADGCHLWSEKYERRVTDVFTVQDELTQAIVSGVRAPLARLRRAGQPPSGEDPGA